LQTHFWTTRFVFPDCGFDHLLVSVCRRLQRLAPFIYDLRRSTATCAAHQRQILVISEVRWSPTRNEVVYTSAVEADFSAAFVEASSTCGVDSNVGGAVGDNSRSSAFVFPSTIRRSSPVGSIGSSTLSVQSVRLLSVGVPEPVQLPAFSYQESTDECNSCFDKSTEESCIVAVFLKLCLCVCEIK
jgi:hypothetical protein